MKPILATVLIVSFVGIAAFGMFMMNHEMHNLGCVASAVNKELCPESGNLFRFSAFHLDAFRSFVGALGNGFAGALALVAFILAAAIGAALTIRLVPQVSLAGYRSRRLSESQSFPLRRRMTRWIAIHEESPSFL